MKSGERKAVQQLLAARTDEYRIQMQPRAQCLSDEVLTLNTERLAGRAGASTERSAQGLHTRVGLARYPRNAVKSLLEEVCLLIAEVLRIHPDEPEPHLVGQVVESLRRGDVVALPTDTFYGLAVDPVNLRAVEHIYDLKSRARHKPLSLLISDVSQAYELARGIDSTFDRLAERFWPGPLTIVVKAGSKLPLRVTANTGNVAIRVPEAAICRAVVSELGLPITATSANLRGLPECTYAGCVREQFGEKIPLIVDGGPTARSVATTIVDLSGGGNSWMILREGAVPTHEIALALQR